MIIYKMVRFHSFMPNKKREKIQEWLNENCVMVEDEESGIMTRYAYITSNYKHSREGDFDVVFINNGEAASLFQMSFPKTKILEIDQEVIYEVDKERFETLFEVT